ncbi:MAG: aspartate aminotransferase family protein [Deltaproteobacteria bacterium]|nr:aspartate aminotransferase family protein [Deltaproteobacteria bacterium]
MSEVFDAIVSREKQVFMPMVRRWPVALERGFGSRVWDVEGREFIDLTAGWGVTAIGHCHPELADAISDQARTLMQTTNIVYTKPQLDLAERLARLAPRGIHQSFFTSSGAEANEGALKLAARKTGRSRFLATLNSFHGRTLGAMGCLGQEKYRGPWKGIVREASFVPFGDVEAVAAALGPEIAAFIVEPIQGEGGVVVPPPDYLRRVADACHAAGALLIADEVQTCVGRTGRWLACDHAGVTPDIVTLGKGLGGGFPLAAFMATEDVMASIQPGDHGGTYAGNPLACRAGATVLRVIEEQRLVERAALLGKDVLARLGDFARSQPEKVECARGLGLLIGLVLRDPAFALRVHAEIRELGVLVNLTADRVLRLFPALNIPEADLSQALDVLEGAIRGTA